ncbi:hypothetical protein GPJ56_007238 [Histomonas meleagridis]|nr:hypothetical protein GPJ56_007238 [Histomonas meleagridis]
MPHPGCHHRSLPWCAGSYHCWASHAWGATLRVPHAGALPRTECHWCHHLSAECRTWVPPPECHRLVSTPGTPPGYLHPGLLAWICLRTGLPHAGCHCTGLPPRATWVPRTGCHTGLTPGSHCLGATAWVPPAVPPPPGATHWSTTLGHRTTATLRAPPPASPPLGLTPEPTTTESPAPRLTSHPEVSPAERHLSLGTTPGCHALACTLRAHTWVPPPRCHHHLGAAPGATTA